MKRYLVFAYDEYYPSGGMNDFVGDYDDLKVAIYNLKRSGMLSGHVYDQIEKKKIFSL